ncbi:MAG: hypothetical protein KKC76_09635 [Proteobacteria bacterium]|nr:hypothetical protein [Pseudomonadota bacterium]MBU4296846.1 hypothetical protein [Pseudomonadota bacterium]MCG2748974.1 hypothetical protein [Desulfobulbaceae bacterium]
MASAAGKSQMVKRTRLRDKKQYKTALGCFALLAVGTLPTLFSNPLEYLMGLGYCLVFSIGIAILLC